MDSQAPPNRTVRYPSAEVSRGLIFDFGLPPLWRSLRRALRRLRRT